ncbi:hypothetical protein PUN28_009023 [Cardiocondyla obscurior]|uniref:Uncharacterized protein n=1 Tax=Cardiocondyla obscurior TaxID=286306 RepID=A0AAW2FSF5_9HYME
MDCKVPRNLEIPYLQAIQKVPGNTAGEKWSWIGRLTSLPASEHRQLPSELLPILRVEIAIKDKNHEDIAWALKSDDLTIVNRALKALWFFDGSCKEIVDVSYFCERLFPYVSVNARMRIILTLARRLAGKDPAFAQQMFTAVTSMYGIQTARPLIIACDEAFAYKTIVDNELVLPINIVKNIFYRNPDLIVRYLKLIKPSESNITERSPFAIGIDTYASFLYKLLKKRLNAFVEICELHENYLQGIALSNTCAEIFLKKAQQHLIKKPLLYINILPLKKINESLMEKIFLDLLPPEESSFDTKKALNYLEHYPRDKKYRLLCESYKKKYCTDLLDETVNVTPALLELMPAEERINQARIKLRKQKGKDTYYYKDITDYTTAWICYLPISESIPVIKELINKTADDSDRLSLILQIIYACKINKDDDALCNTLTYILNRHKNESSWIFERMFDELLQIYDVPHLNEKQISLILDIVRLFHVKNNFVPEDIVSAIIHFKLIHNMPIDKLIDMYLKSDLWYKNFNILKKYPQYERQCLVTFANVLKKISFKDPEEKTNQYCHVVVAMYEFNERCKQARVKIDTLTIKDYPWLMKIVFKAIRSKEDPWQVKSELQKNEPELYRTYFPKSIADVTSAAALSLLKRDWQSVLDNWEKYLENCIKNYHLKHVQSFVKATRWYKDLPVKFADCCKNYLHEEDTDKISPSIIILAILLHGDVVTKLIDPFIPTEKTIDTNHPKAKDNYEIIENLPLGMRLSNPPISIDLVIRLCEGDYLSIALMALMNIGRRISSPKVISAAQKLMNMRVSTRKHGIKLMYLATSVHELTDFLRKTWATETHHSVRQVLFKTSQNFFLTNSSPETWSLYCEMMSTLNPKDEDVLTEMKLFSEIPKRYIAKYLQLWLKTIDDFLKMEIEIQKINKYTADYLRTLTEPVFNLLPEEFAADILRRFLFHINTDVSDAARCFAVSYILSQDKDKYAARIKIFADVFYNAVTTNWNVAHPTKSHFTPVNKAVHLFMDDFVINYVEKFCFKKSNPEIIDNMQTIFLSVLAPSQDAKSYLLLVYAKKLQECTITETSFGLKLGQQLKNITDIFSSLLIPFMADVLNYFLSSVYKNSNLDEIKLDVIEGLIKANNTDSCFMAVIMLPSTIRTKHLSRYDQLITQFKKMEKPVTTILYDYLNKTDLKIID